MAEIDFNLALIVVSASIVLSGLILGIGKALNNKRLEGFGIEELSQSILNAAIVGGILIITGTVAVISTSASQHRCIDEGDVISDLMCSFTSTSTSSFSLLQETIKLAQIVGYYQTLDLNFGSFSIQPFANLEAVSKILSSQVDTLQFNMMLVNLNLQILYFIFQNALGLLLAVGLILRAFFATRKMGGFIISISFGLFLVYPSFISIFPDPASDLNASLNLTRNFNSNIYYATVPILDLNDNYAIAGKIDNMTTRTITTTNTNVTTTSVDFIQDLTQVVQSNSSALSRLLVYSVIAPIFSLIITIIFIMELTTILSSELISPAVKIM